MEGVYSHVLTNISHLPNDKESKPMKSIAPIVLFASLSSTALAIQPEANWIRHYNGEDNRSDSAWMLALGPNGSVSITGVSKPANLREDIYTIRYNSDGDVIWEHRHNSPLDWFDTPVDIEADAQGNTYLLGQQYGGLPVDGGSHWDYLIIKYAPDGSILWSTTYNGPLNSWDTSTSMAIDDMGNLYISGFASVSAGDNGSVATHFHMLKLDADGNQVWEQLFDLDPHFGAGAREVQIAPDGNIVATGTVIVENDMGVKQDDILTLKVSPEGEILWSRVWNTTDSIDGMDDAFHVRFDQQGNIFVLGHTFTSSNNRNFDSLILKYSPSGDLHWSKALDFVLPDGIGELVSDEQGNLYITGGWENVRDADGFLISLDPDGNERWRVVYDDAHTLDFQEAMWVTLADDGNLYVGLDWDYDDANVFDYTIAVHTTQGEQLEQWRFDAGSTSDTFQSLGGWAMDEQGNILIAAYSWFDNADYTVLSVPTAIASCLADLNNDNTLDFFDVSAFLAAFGAQDPAADFEPDGNFNFLDVSAFLAAFAAGCP